MSKRETHPVRRLHHDPSDSFPQTESARKPSECRAFLGVVHERLPGLPTEWKTEVVHFKPSEEVLGHDHHGAHDALPRSEGHDPSVVPTWSPWPCGQK